MVRKRRETDHVHCECVAAYQSEVRDLKRRLAEATTRDPMLSSGKPIKRTGHRDSDWLDDLPDQDRAFFQRKMGIKK